jgi:hypothetical protein
MLSNRHLFALGRCVATPGALEALERSGESALTYLMKHVTGEQGALGEEDHKLNQEAIRTGESRVFSAYLTAWGDKLYVITEHDRSVTTILRPKEY